MMSIHPPDRPGMTSVKIIDFNYVHYVNAEVEVLLPEESGIVQIEVLPRSSLNSIALACALTGHVYKLPEACCPRFVYPFFYTDIYIYR